MVIVKRSSHNPILKPNRKQSWETTAVFNGCPVQKGLYTYLVYRALSSPHYHTISESTMMVSDIGIARSKDEVNFSDRKRFIYPEHVWERFGCEDPRITKLDGKYYTFYTALSTYPFSADGIKVAVAISKNLKTIDEKHLVTPFNAKAMALFPERIKGKMWAVLTVDTDRPPSKIALASFDNEKEMWSEGYWNKWYGGIKKHSLELERKDIDNVEVGAPPIKTKEGWLLLYSYIQGYFSSQKLFTVEAVLLDLKNPCRVIARTEMPILTPEEYYEKIGIVPDIVFPSGALLRGDWISLYYGAADTTVCLARIRLSSLLENMLQKKRRMAKLKRAPQNPILTPKKENKWESKAVFNPAAIRLNEKVHILYRAMSDDNTSVFGYATSKDGIRIDYRASEPAYVPRGIFEQKLTPGSNSGCEDPRLTEIGNRLYVCYTAFDSKNPPRVALSSISTEDFLQEKWNWADPVLISPPNLDDKDAILFPEKVNGQYMFIHRSGQDIDLAFTNSLDFKGDHWIEEYRWLGPRKGWWDEGEKVGASAPPIRTKEGWIFLYHSVGYDSVYRIGAALLNLKDPVEIIGRSDMPIFEPRMPYELEGQVPNVVFPCGAVEIKDKIYVYYGGGDSVVGVATIKTKDLLRVLK